MSVFALPILFDDVVARFAAESSDITNIFGRVHEHEHVEADRRIVWIPGDPVGAVGAVEPPRQSGHRNYEAASTPRPLGTLVEVFHVVISAVDESDLFNRRAQYEATRAVFDAWWRAVHHAGRKTVRLIGAEWDQTKELLERGATIRATCTIESAIIDEPFDGDSNITEAPRGDGGTAGTLDVHELDVTDTVSLNTAPVDVAAASQAPVALSGPQTVDGVSVGSGAVVLVRAQADATENGLYAVAAGAWSRTADLLRSGMYAAAAAGTSGAALYELTTIDPITPGVTPQTWARVGASE